MSGMTTELILARFFVWQCLLDNIFGLSYYVRTTLTADHGSSFEGNPLDGTPMQVTYSALGRRFR